VTNRRDGFAGPHEVPHKGHGRLVEAQLVGVDRATGQDECVELVDRRLADRAVDGERPRGFQIVVTRLDLSGFDRQQFDLSTGSLHGGAWLFEFDLLHAVCGEDGDLAAL